LASRNILHDLALVSEHAPIRTLIADDSAVVRTFLRNALATPSIEICAQARDGIECIEHVKRYSPDVLILDIEMPRMDGLQVLDHLKSIAPQLPVIMFSSLTEHGAHATLNALARGAQDYVTKPAGHTAFDTALNEVRRQLIPKISELARIHRQTLRRRGLPQSIGLAAHHLALAAMPPVIAPVRAVVIAISTGGPCALEQMLPHLPSNFPVPILIVQHMPAIFTQILARRLDSICALNVREAADGESIRAGDVWLARGDWHMQLRRAPGEVRLHLNQSEPEHFCRPAADKLFRSAIDIYGAGVLGVVMTGMGSDGAFGAQALQRIGGLVIAQDEASSVIWGMPRRAIELGAAYRCTSPVGIAAELVRRVVAVAEGHHVSPRI
jgi:two-component system chemotaxis response regulator CheB